MPPVQTLFKECKGVQILILLIYHVYFFIYLFNVFIYYKTNYKIKQVQFILNETEKKVVLSVNSER